VQLGEVGIIHRLRAVARLDLNRAVEIVERLIERAGLGVRRRKRIEQMRFVRPQSEGFFEERSRLQKIADVQREDAAVIKLVGIARRSVGRRNLLVADLNVSLGARVDLDFLREAVMNIFEELFRFFLMAAIENFDRVLEGAQNAR
jgi:hypothetical protein